MDMDTARDMDMRKLMDMVMEVMER